jgi:hypothetical protein
MCPRAHVAQKETTSVQQLSQTLNSSSIITIIYAEAAVILPIICHSRIVNQFFFVDVA